MPAVKALLSRLPKLDLSSGLLLFGFIFVAFGASLAISLGGSMLWRYQATADWQQVPAELSQLEFLRAPNQAKRWQVTVQYSYEFGGRSYRSQQLGLSEGPDSFEHYWRQLYTDLQRRQEAGRLQAWVNPAAPEQALLTRQLHLPLLGFSGYLGGMIVLLGAGIMWLGVCARTDISLEVIARQGISSGTREGADYLSWFGGLFTLASLPLVFSMPAAVAEGNRVLLVLLVLPLIGIISLCAGLRARQRYNQIGATRLFPDPLPGYSGGQVGGYFRLTQGEWLEPPRCTLSCVHVYHVYSLSSEHNGGRRRETRRVPLWQQQTQAYCRPSAKGIDTHFVFDVPAHLPATGDHPQATGTIEWAVVCEGLVRQADRSNSPDTRATLAGAPEHEFQFERAWQLPVEVGSGRARRAVVQPQREQPNSATSRQVAKPATAQPVIERTTKGLRIKGKREIETLMIIGLWILGLTFSALGAGLLYLALNGQVLLWLLGPPLLLIGLAVLLLALIWPGLNVSSLISPGQVCATRRWYFLPLQRRCIAVHSRDQLELQHSMTSIDNQVTTQSFKLLLRSANQPIPLTGHIAGRAAADALCKQVLDQLFPDAQPTLPL